MAELGRKALSVVDGVLQWLPCLTRLLISREYLTRETPSLSVISFSASSLVNSLAFPASLQYSQVSSKVSA